MPRPAETFENLQLPAATIDLPIEGPSFARPSRELLDKLSAVGTATASALLHKIGVRQTLWRVRCHVRRGAKWLVQQ